jgi:hypothetical protein
MAHYFSNFPITQYNGQLCRSLISRTALTQDVIKSTSAFYPYTNMHNERADTIAHHYYQDSYMDWLLYFANDVVDPYYGWYLNGEQFGAYLQDKYQSVYDAQLYIHHFQVDWLSDDRQLTIAAYDALPATPTNNLKQYWQPVLNEYGATASYKRKPMDTVATTNRMLKLTMSSTAGFEQGEIISQFNNNVLSGYGEITFIDPDYLIIRHVMGSIGTSYPVVGFKSATSNTPQFVTVVQECIPVAEQAYWRAVTIYEHEEMLNEQRKVLRVIGKQFAEQASNNLKTILS